FPEHPKRFRNVRNGFRSIQNVSGATGTAGWDQGNPTGTPPSCPPPRPNPPPPRGEGRGRRRCAGLGGCSSAKVSAKVGSTSRSRVPPPPRGDAVGDAVPVWEAAPLARFPPRWAHR